MKDHGHAITILDVLGVDLCARAIFDLVHVIEVVRTTRVCRRWQIIVHNYLQTRRHNGILYNVYTFYLKSFREKCPSHYTLRQTNTYFAHESMLSTCKALDKIGPASDYCFKNISSGCPYLRHLNLLSEESIEISSKIKISELIKYKRKNALSITDPNLLTADISKHIKSNELSLKLIRSTIYTLQNVTSLELDNHNVIKRDYVRFLLNAMPQLENLSYCDYTCKYNSIIYNDTHVVSNDELIESISQLTNLKRLHMRNNMIVNENLLKALLRCKELKYLDISYDSTYKNWPKNSIARGVATLCNKSSATSLYIGYIQNLTARSLKIYIQGLPVIREFENLGCSVELTPQRLEETSLASQAKMQPLELTVRNAHLFISSQAQTDINAKLKIVLNTDVHNEQISDFNL